MLGYILKIVQFCCQKEWNENGFVYKLNTIQFITIQTTGNSSEYVDLTSARGYTSGMSNSIRWVFAGGYEPTQVNTIDFVNIATTSNAIDFGDLSLGVNFVTQATSDSHGGLW